MNAPITVRELPDLSARAWDAAIASYRNATVFHASAWHQGLNDALPGRVVRFQVEMENEVCGHWCGFLVTKFGLKVFGAPLPGTATDYMYPLFSKTPAVEAFLKSVRTWG